MINEYPQEKQTTKFDWPATAEFFQLQEQFLRDHLEEVVEELAEKYDLTTEEVTWAATIINRCGFVYQYMVDHTPISFPCEVTFDKLAIEEADTLGYCLDTWSIDNQPVLLTEVSPQDLPRLVLEHISVQINWDHICDKVVRTLQPRQDRISALVDDGELEESATDYVLNSERGALDEEAIRMERVVVEEVAHAFYYASAAQNPRTLQLLLDVRKNARDDDSYDRYLLQNLEQRARIWVREFLRRYYPGSKTHNVADAEKKRIDQLLEANTN